MKKNYLFIFIILIFISSCNKKPLPNPDETYNFYISCAKENLIEAEKFLDTYPDYANIPLYETTSDLKRYIKTKTVYNNNSYQDFFNYLCNEGIIEFTNDEINNGEKKKLQISYKRYPINIAARYGNLEIVKLLLSHNADINICEENGNTPLISAVQNNHLDVVKVLLENNANVYDKNNNDNNAITLAIVNNNIEIVRELLNKIDNIESTSQGYTPLMIAASYDNKEIMELLIEKGANINAKTKDGQTALELCAIDGNKLAIEVLLKHGVNINEQGTNGNTALMSAAGTDNFELVKYLINAGADTKLKNTLGYNALDFAVAAYEQNKKSFQIIDYLERKGLNCNVVNLVQYKQQYVKALPKPVTPESQFKYKLADDGKGVMITKYIGNSKVLEIPSQLEGFPVTQIGQWESIFDKSYKKVIFDELIIHDTVTTIKNEAFSGANIRKIRIPEHIKSFNGSAVSDIGYLEELILPSVIESNDFGISFTETCNLKEIIIPKSKWPSYYVSLSFEKTSKVNKIIISEGIKNVSLYGKIKNVGEIIFPMSIECITGRMLIYPDTKYTFPNPNKQLHFSYYDMFHSEYVQNFLPYVAANLSLREQKEIQDIWRNLGFTGYFAEENMF